MSRSYAEQLVGNLDNSFYNKQRDVAQQTYKTNWENLQNQYKNLQEKLKKQQEEANIAFNEGLSSVAENSYDRMSSANQNLANRGLTSSGLGNLAKQQDITAKGQDVLDLLGSSGDISINTANQLASGNTSLANKVNSLGKDLSDLLGDIGDAETEAQMEQNAILADISEGKVARDEANELAAKQRALSRSSSGSNNYNDEIEEFYKRQALSEILVSPTLSDAQKSQLLQINYGYNNPQEIVKAYNDNVNAQTNYDNQIADLEERIRKENKVSKAYNREAENLIKEINDSDTRKSWMNSDNVSGRNAYETLYNYVNGIGNVSKNDAANAYANLMGSMSALTEKNYIMDAVDNILNPKESETTRQLNELKNAGITYSDLAELLYGNK